MIRVLGVDDDPFVCASLETILNAQDDLAVVAKGTSGPEAVSLYEAHLPDVVLMDIQMVGGDGLSAAEQIIAAYADARVLFLTTFADDDYIVRALHLGAKGYLIKQNVTDIAPAVRAVAAGQNVLGDEVVGHISRTPETRVSTDGFAKLGLTEREIEVVELVAQGLDNHEIAAELFMGEGTVRNHISAILQKLQLKNRTQIAVMYYRMG